MSNDKLLITIPEAAEQLSIGRSLVYELVLRGELPSIRIGRCRRIAQAELNAYVEGLQLGRTKTDDVPPVGSWARSSENSEDFLNGA